MDPEALLARHGGLATWRQLVGELGRPGARAALADGRVQRVGYGRYAAAGVAEAPALAHAVSGALCLESAALELGWEVLRTPENPHVAFPRKRKLSLSTRAKTLAHRRDLMPDDVNGARTSRDLTLLMCLTQLDLPDALAVADSALRHGTPPSVLRRVALEAQGPGAVQARRVAHEASALAANPFESAVRAIAMDVPGLALRPQVTLRIHDREYRPDLVDDDLMIAVEADSFEWHGTRSGLVRDARRYDALIAAGWLVLRFTWEDVMLHADEVAQTLRDVVKRRTEMMCPGCIAA